MFCFPGEKETIVKGHGGCGDWERGESTLRTRNAGLCLGSCNTFHSVFPPMIEIYVAEFLSVKTETKPTAGEGTPHISIISIGFPLGAIDPQRQAVETLNMLETTYFVWTRIAI